MVDFAFMDSLSGRLFLYFGLFCGFLLVLFFVYLIVSRKKKKAGEEEKSEPKRLSDGPATSEQVIPSSPGGDKESKTVIGYNN